MKTESFTSMEYLNTPKQYVNGCRATTMGTKQRKHIETNRLIAYNKFIFPNSIQFQYDWATQYAHTARRKKEIYWNCNGKANEIKKNYTKNWIYRGLSFTIVFLFSSLFFSISWHILSLLIAICVLFFFRFTTQNHSIIYDAILFSMKFMIPFWMWTVCGRLCSE